MFYIQKNKSIIMLKICKNGHCIENSITSKPNPSFDLCSTNPCLNNGTCVQTIKIYICKCENGFKGFSASTPQQYIE
jgi:hypothetical protein